MWQAEVWDWLPEITSINIINGNYNMTREISKTSRRMSMRLLDVVFPCRNRVTITDQFLDIEIKEAVFGKYLLDS